MEKLINKIYCGDCLELMKQIPDKSIDMILCDLPYWTTACSWDVVIPFEPLREAYKRIIKDNWAIVLFWSQPFTTDLINSNRKWFRYEIIWNKTFWKDPFATWYRPQKAHENICVYYKNQPKFNPQYTIWKPYIDKRDWEIKSEHYNHKQQPQINLWTRNPISVIEFINPNTEWQHPTQKPLDLCKYLISTYTDKWELVLDNTCWSWTTAVACKELGRNFIGIEKEQKYVDIANKRLVNTTISLF